MRKSTRIGCISEFGGSPFANSMAVIPENILKNIKAFFINHSFIELSFSFHKTCKVEILVNARGGTSQKISAQAEPSKSSQGRLSKIFGSSQNEPQNVQLEHTFRKLAEMSQKF